eukprot:tig00000194_g14760.t1
MSGPLRLGAAPGRLSGLQKQVLQLYRLTLRAAEAKDASSRSALKDFIRSEFRRQASIPKTEVTRIEFMLRRGKKQLETLQQPSITGFSIVQPSDRP